MGNARRSREIISWQRKLGISEPLVLVSSRQDHYVGGDLTKLDEIPTKMVPVSPFERGFRRWRWSTLDGKHLEQTIRTEARAQSADVLHVHASSVIGMSAARAAKRLGLPLVAEVRYDLASAFNSESFGGRLSFCELFLRRYFERHLPSASVVVTASHALAELIANIPGGKSVAAVPNGVRPVESDADPARVDARRQALGLTPGKMVVGTTSNMLHYEGPDLLLDALPSVADVELLMVGGGPMRDMLKAKAARLPIKAVFVGRVPPE